MIKNIIMIIIVFMVTACTSQPKLEPLPLVSSENIDWESYDDWKEGLSLDSFRIIDGAGARELFRIDADQYEALKKYFDDNPRANSLNMTADMIINLIESRDR